MIFASFLMLIELTKYDFHNFELRVYGGMIWIDAVDFYVSTCRKQRKTMIHKDEGRDHYLSPSFLNIAQFFLNILATKDTELLWLENPDTHQYRSPWKQHVITHGPDVYFRNLKVNTTDGVYDVIVTTEFFAKKLSVHWTTDSMNRWNDLSKVVCTIRNSVSMIW